MVVVISTFINIDYSRLQINYKCEVNIENNNKIWWENTKKILSLTIMNFLWFPRLKKHQK